MLLCSICFKSYFSIGPFSLGPEALLAGKASPLHCWLVLQAPPQHLIPFRHACHTGWLAGVLHAGEDGEDGEW